MGERNEQTILVVGASSGIGEQIFNQAKANGIRVFTMGRQPVKSDGHLFFDASSPVPDLPADWPDSFSGLVYCPGTINLKPITRLTSADFLTDFQVNVLGFVSVIQAMLPRLRKANGSSVLVFSTVAAKIGMGFHASISAAKGGLQSLAISLASELAPLKIRVNVISPSLTDTKLAQNLLNTPEKREASAKRHPLQNLGNAGEIAATSLHLLGPESSWITGQIISIDGGMSSLK
ncbi:MAG TPA: SDR family oxidoreductase [Catalimonadaceae bacterium]|jgi:3-oxoacyl-[acyl-carrier protein] reductase|nr:SDR family oxidoreductase [Catalimonadaceae bacterium]